MWHWIPRAVYHLPCYNSRCSHLEYRNWGDSSWLAELWRGIPPWKPGWRWVQSSTTTMCWGSGDRAEWRRSYRRHRTMGNRMHLRHLPSLTAALPFWITTRMGDNEIRWSSCTASNPTSTKRSDDTSPQLPLRIYLDSAWNQVCLVVAIKMEVIDRWMAFSTKMSQLGHYETIRTLGKVHWERSSWAKSRENDFIDNV